jgi:hypothetical protein
MAWMLLMAMWGNEPRLAADPRAGEMQVDMIELQHVGDERARIIYTQVILWRRHEDGTLHNWGWRMVDARDRRDWPVCQRGLWMVRGASSSTQHVRFVAPLLRESWAHVDAEREDDRRYWKSRGGSPNWFQSITDPDRTRQAVGQGED